MTDAVTGDCPVCSSSNSAKEQFVTANVAEHVKEKPHRNETHQEWIDEHTTNGTLEEIRTALNSEQKPR